MREIGNFIATVLAPFIIFGILILGGASLYGFIINDISGVVTAVIHWGDPRSHMWVRIVYVVWLILSFFISAIFNQLG